MPRRQDRLRLAAALHGRLITFDRTIRWRAVTGCGPGDLEVLTGGIAG